MPVTSDVFTHDDLYDAEIVHEAHQLDTALVEILDAVPRFEIAMLISLTKRFVDICEQADIDPVAAFFQIAEGVEAEAFEPTITSFIHAGTNTVN